MRFDLHKRRRADIARRRPKRHERRGARSIASQIAPPSASWIASPYGPLPIAPLIALPIALPIAPGTNEIGLSSVSVTTTMSAEDDFARRSWAPKLPPAAHRGLNKPGIASTALRGRDEIDCCSQVARVRGLLSIQ